VGIICADLALVLCCAVLCCAVLCCAEDDLVLDEDAVSCADLRDWSVEFESLTDRVSALFVRLNARAFSAVSGRLARAD
jgi:hypothetical protein